jgi:hypothetical protein
LAEDVVSAELTVDHSLYQIQKHLRREFPGDKIITITEYPSPGMIQKTLDQSLRWEDIVFVAYALPNSYRGTADLNKNLLALISGLRNKIGVMILIGNPYAARELPKLPCLLYAYSGAYAEQAAIEVLAGKYASRGCLPIRFLVGQ